MRAALVHIQLHASARLYSPRRPSSQDTRVQRVIAAPLTWLPRHENADDAKPTAAPSPSPHAAAGCCTPAAAARRARVRPAGVPGGAGRGQRRRSSGCTHFAGMSSADRGGGSGGGAGGGATGGAANSSKAAAGAPVPDGVLSITEAGNADWRSRRGPLDHEDAGPWADEDDGGAAARARAAGPGVARRPADSDRLCAVLGRAFAAAAVRPLHLED
jgi:hypothetical protein